MNNLLGKYLKKRRMDMKLSLREFGKLCDISHTHIDSIEKGVDPRTGKKVNITNETLHKLAKVLCVSESYLLNLSLGIEGEEEDPQIITIKRASKKMTPQDKQRMVDMLKIAFEEAFKDDDNK